MKKHTRKIVKAAVTLSAGNIILGRMGMGTTMAPVMAAGASGLGLVATAGYGAKALSYVKKKKRRK